MKSQLIKDFVRDRFLDNYEEAAAAGGMSYSSLVNAISKKYRVMELASGDFILVRKQVTIFRGKRRV